MNALIKFVPISLYSVILGLAGFAIALQKIEQISGVPPVVSPYFLFFALLVFTVITIFYLIKIAIFPEEFKSEFRHPNKLNFFSGFFHQPALIQRSFFGNQFDRS